MLKNIEDSLGKTCLIGLSYFDLSNEPLKQTMMAGVVKKVDKELGITFELIGKSKKTAEFILPANLDCWFIAPKGDFHTSQEKIKVTNPDFLITWNIHQTKEDVKDGEQQWWDWIPNTQPPFVNK